MNTKQSSTEYCTIPNSSHCAKSSSLTIEETLNVPSFGVKVPVDFKEFQYTFYQNSSGFVQI